MMAILGAALVFTAGCWGKASDKKSSEAKASTPVHDNILVIINDNSKDSIEVGDYYVEKRNIPAKNILHVKCVTEEAFPDWSAFADNFHAPILEYLKKEENRTRIDYIVLTKGIPIGMRSFQSVDSLIASIFLLEQGLPKKPNPFFDSEERFSSKKFGFYLVTRLDGYDVSQAKRLVDLSLEAKPRKGWFLFDQDPTRHATSYDVMNRAMETAHNALSKGGFLSYLNGEDDFVSSQKELMGYFSWGSNDRHFNSSIYKSNKFAPGAIAETAVSTSGRTFHRTTEGQSLIADLIESGVTGVKGYFAEPGLAGIAWPPILFDRYTCGWNLAESFYAASRFLVWKDIVIGDPLCAPYAQEANPKIVLGH